MARPKGPSSSNYSLRLSDETWAAIDAVTQQESITRATFIREAVEAHLGIEARPRNEKSTKESLKPRKDASVDKETAPAPKQKLAPKASGLNEPRVIKVPELPKKTVKPIVKPRTLPDFRQFDRPITPNFKKQ